jgi:hypothetical protein
MTDDSLSKEAVREQQRDAFCSTLEIRKAKGRTQFFRDDEEVIYRRRRIGQHQLVVPQSLVKEVVAEISPINGRKALRAYDAVSPALS